MKSNIPLIIFGLFFVVTFGAFLFFKKRDEEEETKSDVNEEQRETVETEE